MHLPPRILLASARSQTVARLKTALADDHVVHQAPDLERALEGARHLEPDVLLVDLALPGGAGDLMRVLEACHRGESALPVLALSSTAEGVSAALRAGAADAVLESVDADELVARLERLLSLKASHDRLLEKAAELERLSLTDSLTGLGNRRLFDARLHGEFLRSQRYRDPVSLLLIDLDRFKSINHRHGHQAGDELLRAVAGALCGAVRGIDVVCRYGGEEFAVILPRTPLAGSLAVARRVCEAVASARPAGGVHLQVTASVGAATLPGEDVHTGPDLIRAADAALYRAKRSGRNCVCAYPSLDAPFLPPARPGEGARA
jgi:diguanylate cyclase (GGDEF)-like protein